MKYPRLSFSRPGFARSGQDTGFAGAEIQYIATIYWSVEL